MHIGTDFLRTYQIEISHPHGHFSILEYTVPLLLKDSSDAFLVSKEETGRRHVYLQYLHGVLGLPYRVVNASFKPLSAYGNNQKGLKLRSNQLVRIPPKTQVAVDTGLYLDLPPGLRLEIISINGVSRKEPLAAPGIRDSAAQETLKVLLLNPLSTETKVSKGQHFVTLMIGHNEELLAVHFLGGLKELRISLPEEPLVAAIIPQDDMVVLSEDDKDSFEALLDEFKDIFAISNEDFGCAEGELYKVNVGDAEPIS
ncbi:hypothetical protein DSO57_1012947 [Entomophthora muscae]|uniref:Uncharacterized protein n=1 Tax=Entomophthora muscae TaxID=34485 RepID=A0ACC2SV18_9FUNG|nr:hypothetical protein DSO57_1012947 [Entomophthora muscae]